MQKEINNLKKNSKKNINIAIKQEDNIDDKISEQIP